MNQDKKSHNFDAGKHELPDYVEEAPASRRPKEPTLADPVKKRWVRRIAITVVVLLVAPFLYKGAKAWRASSLLRQSEVSFAVGDAPRALSLMKQALALAPASPAIQRAVELYNARAGDAGSLNKILARMRDGSSDHGELLGIAELEVTNSPEVTREALSKLTGKLSGKEHLRKSLLEALLIAREGNVTGAANRCLADAEKSSGQEASRLKVQAALYFLNLGDEHALKKACDLLQSVIAQHNEASLSAWRLLSRMVLASPEQKGILDEGATIALADQLPSIPDRDQADEFLAADLRIRVKPEDKESVVSRLLKKYRNGSRVEMMGLARWLNGRKEQEKVIELAGPDRPRNDTDWLLIVMDAKCSLGDWKGAGPLLESPAAAGIQEAVRHLYLARVATVNGDSAIAEEEWRRVGGALHFEKTETLFYIAGYEEQTGDYEHAARTYREIADRRESAEKGLIGLIRCQPADASAKKLIPFYEELRALQKDNPDVSGDLSYLKLLAQEDVAENASIAEKLYALQPNMLTRISAVALARLRLGNPKGAMEVYDDKQIDWKTAAGPWKAVRCAVMRSNGAQAEASSLAESIEVAKLRPEEKALLKSDSPIGKGRP